MKVTMSKNGAIINSETFLEKAKEAKTKLYMLLKKYNQKRKLE